LRPPYDHWPLTRRPRLELPGGARVAFWIGLNVEYYPAGVPGLSLVPLTADFVPDPMNQGWRDYGPRVGLWRIADVLDRHGMRASAMLHSDACVEYPEVTEEGNARGWCWVAHGRNNAVFHQGMELEEERAVLGEVTDTIERHAGRRPRGWLGPALTETANTLELLAGLGYDYVCDWCCDDQPFPLRAGGDRMISVPYTVELNDIPIFLGKGAGGADFRDIVVDQFDVLYEQAGDGGLVMCVSLHSFLAGLPFRLKYLDEALAHIGSREDVWLATSDEIADWYLERHYDEALAVMAPGLSSSES
jgi:peptidoglycan/xylan/chitin deacetylase (PgdA/CDA1 family)